MLAREAVTRRRALKQLSTRMPFRPGLKFAYLYILRGGFLDGYPGFAYSRMLAAYEAMIVTLNRDQRRRATGEVAE